MRTPTLLFIIFTLTFAFFLPFSGAQNPDEPAPPSAVTIEVFEVYRWNPTSNVYDSRFNITFNKSIDDDGTLTYNWWGTNAGSCLSPCLLATDLVGSFTPPTGGETGRTNWLYFRSDSSGGTDANWTYYITANKTGQEESIFSCSVNVDLNVNGSFSQCGDTIEAPEGVGLLSQASPTATTFGIVDMRWFLSPDDPDQANGTFDYWPAQGPKPSLMTNYTGATPTVRSEGIQNFSFDVGGNGGKFPFYGKVLARDPLTHQRSDYSCIAFVDAGQQYASSGCGTFSTNLADIAGDEPQCMFTNCTLIAEYIGAEESMVAYLYGAFVLLGIGIMCFLAGGFVVGILGLVLTICLLTAFAIFPVWMLITVFALCLTMVVLKLMPGGASE
jgi:hypothetical protein